MLEEWYRKNIHKIMSSKYKVLKKYLRENSEIEFSLSDVKLFLNIFNCNYLTIIKCLNLFFSNEKRVTDLLLVCDENRSFVPVMVNALSAIELLYTPSSSTRITLENFLYKKFPIKFFDDIDNYDNYGVSLLHFLCCSHQKEEFVEIEKLDKDLEYPLDKHYFFNKIKKSLPYENYIHSLRILMRCNNFKNFIKNESENFRMIEKFKKNMKYSYFIWRRIILSYNKRGVLSKK